MYNEKFIYKNFLASLKVPFGWKISKNNLIDLPDEILTSIDNDLLFILKESYFYECVYYSVYSIDQIGNELILYVHYNQVGKKINEGKYSIEACLIKKKKILFHVEKDYQSLKKLILALNNFQIEVVFEIEEIMLSKNFYKISEFLL